MRGRFAFFAVGTFLWGCGSSDRSPTPNDDTIDETEVSVCADGVPRCPGDRCAGGRCALVRLAGAIGNVFGVDESHVYWASSREIDRIPKCGGTTEVLVLSQDEIKEPRLHGDAIYFRFDAQPDRIYRSNKAGGASEELVADPELGVLTAGAITLAGDVAYLVANGGVMGFPLGGDPASLVFSGSVAAPPGTDGERAYVYSTYPEHGFFALERERAMPFYLIEETGALIVSASASDKSSLYVALAPSGEVTLQRLDPGAGATPLALLDERPQTVRVDDRCVYVSANEGTKSGIHRVPKDGGALELVAGAGVPFAIDENSVFFVSGNDLYRLPK